MMRPTGRWRGSARQEWWAGTGLNRRHQDFQTRPLPPARTDDLFASVMIRGFRRVDFACASGSGRIETHDSVRVEFESTGTVDLDRGPTELPFLLIRRPGANDTTDNSFSQSPSHSVASGTHGLEAVPLHPQQDPEGSGQRLYRDRRNTASARQVLPPGLPIDDAAPMEMPTTQYWADYQDRLR